MNRTTKILMTILSGTIIVSVYLFLRDYAYNNQWNSPIDSLIFSHWGGFISGIMASGALVFTYFTFLQQRKDNDLKKEQDELFRNNQEFENRFFRMIENLQFIVGQIMLSIPQTKVNTDGTIDDKASDYNTLILTDKDYKITNRIYDNRAIKITGREALHILLINLKSGLKDVTIDDIWDEEQTDEQREKMRYDEFYDKYFYLIGHYFRYIYHIVLYIAEQTIITEEKKMYFVKLLQAQVSTDEMGLIFYNAVLNEKAKKKETGEAKFHQLLEQYKFLENIDNRSLVDKEHKMKYYPETFGNE